MPGSRHIRDFIAIARARSLRGAAAALGLTQPAISRSLQELEKELGVPLVERRARGVVLTPAGEKFLLRAQVATESIRRGTEEVRQFVGDFHGSVAVAMTSAPALALLPSAYPRFRRAWPGIGVRFIDGQFHQVEPRLRTGELDFYVGPCPARELCAGYGVELIARHERVVIARHDHPLAGAQSLAELIGAEWLIAGLRDRVEAEFEEVFSACDLPSPAVRTRAESMLALQVILATSDALAFLPQAWAESALFRGVLARIPVRETLAAPDIVEMHAHALPLTPAAQAFATLLQRAAGKPFARGADLRRAQV